MADKNLTAGPVPRLVVTLAIPSLTVMLLQSMYALVNLVFVGRLGGPAVAALSISINTFFIVLALGQAMGTGGLALLAQAYGRGERAKVPYIFQQLFWLTLALGVVFWILGILVADPFIRAFSADPEVIALGVPFFRVFAASFFNQMVMIALSFSFRAVGDFVAPAIIFGVTILLNVVLDITLIFGVGPFPRLGLMGAGIATSVAQGVGVLAYVWLVTASRRSSLLVVRRPFTLDPAVLWRLVKIGIPSGVQNLLFTAILMLGYRYVRPFGADATASVGIGFRVIQSCIMPCVALATSVASLVGQNYGARKPERVKAAIVWGFTYAIGISAAEYGILAIAPHFWVSLFAHEESIISIGSLYLVVMGLILPLNAYSMIVTFAAQGLGRTVMPMLAVGLRLVVYIVALQVVEATIGITLTSIFWTGAAISVVDLVTMSGVLVGFWRRVLKVPPATAPSGPVVAPAPEIG